MTVEHRWCRSGIGSWAHAYRVLPGQTPAWSAGWRSSSRRSVRPVLPPWVRYGHLEDFARLMQEALDSDNGKNNNRSK